MWGLTFLAEHGLISFKSGTGLPGSISLLYRVDSTGRPNFTDDTRTELWVKFSTTQIKENDMLDSYLNNQLINSNTVLKLCQNEIIDLLSRSIWRN